VPSPPLAIGRPAPEYGIAIVDDDEVPVAQARAIEPGGSGQLLIKGVRALSLFQEYLGNAAATEASYTADGWFRTGDRVDLLEDGSIRFGDRTKDMLKVGGENVAALEIESFISNHPAVKFVQVVGVPDPKLEEVAAAFVELKPGCTATEAEIVDFCRGRIASFKVPRHVRFVTDWPMSSTKVQKFRLRDTFLAERGSEPL